MLSLNLHYGGPVSGNHRFPRPDLEKKLLNLLKFGAGAKMFGLRRTGKSTLLRFAEDEMENQGYTVVSIDAQGMRSIDSLLFGVFNALQKDPQGFFDRMYGLVGCDPAIPAAVKKLFEMVLKGEKHQDTDRTISDYWPLFSKHIVQVLKDAPPKLLLTIDELPFLIQNMIEDHKETGAREVDQLLAALREWRNDGLKMIVSGSVGMAGLARKNRFRNDHLNDLTPLVVPELTEDEARELVRAATEETANGKWTADHTEALFLELGALYPSFLIESLIVLGHKDPPSPDEFPDIFATRIRPELNDTFLSQFDRRYKKYEEMDTAPIIQPILVAILRQPGGLSEADIQFDPPCDPIDRREALAILSEDGFLCFAENREGLRTWKTASRLVLLWGRKTLL